MWKAFRRSWELGRASWSLLRGHPTLMLFTLISMVAVVIASGIVIGGAFAIFSDDWVPESYDDPSSVPAIVVAVVVGFIATFLTIYFNTGLTASVLRIASGQPATFNDGISAANSRLGVILQWTLISLTVGLLLRFLRERLGAGGALLSFLGDVAWSLATFFVVPVLATKRIGPIDAIRESAGLLRRTWGEQVVGQAGVGIFAIIVTAPVWIIAFLGIGIGLTSGSIAATVVGIAFGAALLALVAAFVSTLATVYRAVLYRWATDHQPAPGFDEGVLSGAFRAKA